MCFIIHRDKDFLQIKDIVLNFEFENKGIRKEGGYLIFKEKNNDLNLVKKILNVENKLIEIYKIEVPNGKIIELHKHNTSIEYFFSENNLELFVENKEILLENNEILEVKSGNNHKTLSKSEKYYFYVILVRFGEKDDKILD